jgi:hypothetical protein
MLVSLEAFPGNMELELGAKIPFRQVQTFPSTAGPPYPQGLHAWIQLTADQNYFLKKK